jgi:mycothiol synthase
MRIDLANAVRPAELPNGIDVRPYRPGLDDDELWDAFTVAFADHWGQAAVDRDHWWQENRDGDTAGFDPGLWFLAWCERAIAGFAVCRVRQDDGGPMGWVSLVGVRPRWRGRGLGHALLTRSLDSLRRRGLSRAGLSVDAANTTGALRLYEQAGMTAHPAFTAWSLDLGESGTT